MKIVFGVVVSLVLSGVVSGCLVGCAPAFPREFEAISKAIATSVTDQALWDNTLASVNGQVINPGIEIEAGLKYFGAAKLTGVSGQVGINATGHGSGVATPEAVKSIRDLLSAQGLPEQVINKVVDAVLAKVGAPVVGDTNAKGTTASPTPAQPKTDGTVAFGNPGPANKVELSVADIASLRAELVSEGVPAELVDGVVKSLTHK